MAFSRLFDCLRFAFCLRKIWSRRTSYAQEEEIIIRYVVDPISLSTRVPRSQTRDGARLTHRSSLSLSLPPSQPIDSNLLVINGECDPSTTVFASRQREDAEDWCPLDTSPPLVLSVPIISESLRQLS
ncbi:hypothetical protein BaRGS_00005400, partial [Batillaria attramentaria]